jgi:twitching motility protein PilT
VPKIEKGRVAALEILINNPAIANLIREDKIHQINAQMQLNQAKTNMQTQTQVLIELIKNRVITKDSAMRVSNSPDDVEKATPFIK